jgi:uncharacterized iron-regulated membrane protein
LTVAIIINGIAVALKKYTTWLGLMAVFLLALLLFTGLYLFVLPYSVKWRSGRRTRTEQAAARMRNGRAERS